MTLLIGYDIGSSSVKAALLDAERGKLVAAATSPAEELPIEAPQPGWAEQRPEMWWEHVGHATRLLRERAAAALGDFDPADVAAIGISYQMHGLVAIDERGDVLRPSIIWCDSRAVELGRAEARTARRDQWLGRCLNLPGNFTASKLKWVREHEPELYGRIARVLLPGDYIAMRLTGLARTTASGLSEGICWDFSREDVAEDLLRGYGIDPALLAERVPTFGHQGELTAEAADALGLRAGTPITYRAGDQPNNALSLGVLEPGEAAVTAGTSGVVYAISDRVGHDPASRVNTFAHVNHGAGRTRLGVLLCLNGTGILNSWLRRLLTCDGATTLSYPQMNELAAAAPIGARGVTILPFGNGAERLLGNRFPGCSISGLDFNLHGRAELLRAAQEGIAFGLNYGLGVMREMGMTVRTIRAGRANMFLSPLFGEAFATVSGARIELVETDGAQGAARGAGIGLGLHADPAAAFAGLETVRTIEPNAAGAAQYQAAYERWRERLREEVEPSGP